MIMSDQDDRMAHRFTWQRFVRNLPSLILFNLLIGLGYSAMLMQWQHLGVTLVTSQCIGFAIYFCISGLHDLFLRWNVPLWLAYVLAVALGIPLGFVLGSVVPSLWIGVGNYAPTTTSLWNGLVFSMLGGFFGIFYFAGRARYLEARQRAEQFSRMAVEAQLRGLQAQVEPHFLFNTLANLDALIAIDPKHARELLGYLNRYLRNTLTHSRRERCTLAEECEVLKAYLNIMEIRLPGRLQASVDCPADCADLPLAPMLLQPLLENAIKHGIEPAADGGRVDVLIARQQDTLRIEVRDTGLGLRPAAPAQGTGTGLANIRERLALLYGPQARLELLPGERAGAIARLEIPLSALKKEAR